jgi:hypothetical protein
MIGFVMSIRIRSLYDDPRRTKFHVKQSSFWGIECHLEFDL